MASLLSSLIQPMLRLNGLIGLLAGVWLLLRGDGDVVGAGLLAMVGLPIAYVALQLPASGLMLLGERLIRQGARLPGKACSFLSLCWTYLTLAAWCALVAGYAFRQPGLAAGAHWPLLMWAFAVVGLPLAYIASQADEARSFAGFQIVAPLAYLLALMACCLLQAPTLAYAGVSMAFVLGAPLVMTVFAQQMAMDPAG